MGKRVSSAKHLGELLVRTWPRSAPSVPKSMVNQLAALKSYNYKRAINAMPSALSSDEVEFIAAAKKTQHALQLAIAGKPTKRRKPKTRNAIGRKKLVGKKTARKTRR